MITKKKNFGTKEYKLVGIFYTAEPLKNVKEYYRSHQMEHQLLKTEKLDDGGTALYSREDN